METNHFEYILYIYRASGKVQNKISVPQKRRYDCEFKIKYYCFVYKNFIQYGVSNISVSYLAQALWGTATCVVRSSAVNGEMSCLSLCMISITPSNMMFWDHNHQNARPKCSEARRSLTAKPAFKKKGDISSAAQRKRVKRQIRRGRSGARLKTHTDKIRRHVYKYCSMQPALTAVLGAH